MTNKRKLEEKLCVRERELGLGSVGVSLRDLFIIIYRDTPQTDLERKGHALVSQYK